MRAINISLVFDKTNQGQWNSTF